MVSSMKVGTVSGFMFVCGSVRVCVCVIISSMPNTLSGHGGYSLNIN